jgi:adenylate kinase family enzyme
MQRVSVVGTTGSGKTTLARELASILAAPHLELDAIHHQPNWTPATDEAFRAGIRDTLARDRWVIDGNYQRQVGDLVWAAADAVVWLDYSRPRVMSRVIRRTLARVITRCELWNGNRERFENLYRLDPEENVVLWAWTRHAINRETFARAMHAPENAHLEFVRLRHPREARALVERVRRESRDQSVR